LIIVRNILAHGRLAFGRRCGRNVVLRVSRIRGGWCALSSGELRGEMIDFRLKRGDPLELSIEVRFDGA